MTLLPPEVVTQVLTTTGPLGTVLVWILWSLHKLNQRMTAMEIRMEKRT